MDHDDNPLSLSEIEGCYPMGRKEWKTLAGKTKNNLKVLLESLC